MWRPVYEMWAVIAWTVAAGILLSHGAPSSWAWALGCMGLAACRVGAVLSLWRFRLAISGQQLRKLSAAQVLEMTRLALGTHDAFWIGYGFAWSQRHAQMAWDILGKNPDETRVLPSWLPERVRLMLLPKGTVRDREAVGASWIHGIGVAEETDLYFPLRALPGHTLIVGTTRAGKTRLYELLSFQAVHSQATIIVLDPKGDKDWEARLRNEAQRAGRDFLYFHPAFPSRSIRLNPLKSWNNPSEIASRIAQLLPSESGGDSFTQFAWLTIDRVVNGMLMVGERPDLRRIKRYIEGGIEPLLEACFGVYFTPIYGHDWDSRVGAYIQKAPSRTHAMVAFYKEDQAAKGAQHETLDGLISTLMHDKEHFGKMILSLLPLLQMLCTGEIGAMLSPDYADLRDTRAPYDLEQVIAGKKILYVGLNSLSNKAVGSAIGSILFADLAAVAGGMYNFGRPEDILVFGDEAAEILNDQAIQILNKAGGAGFKAFLATQTIADFEARLGNKAKALQTLGNTNNLFALRVRDYDTAQWVARMMGETSVKSLAVSHSIGSESEATVLEFKGSVSRSMKEERAPLVSPDVLVRMPNLQYVAMIAGGRIVKGRVPIIGD